LASQPCFHCGELFDPEGKLVCPHCGADVDFTYAEDPSDLLVEDEGEGYEDFLRREGLAPEKRGRGCLLALLAAPFFGLVLLLL